MGFIKECVLTLKDELKELKKKSREITGKEEAEAIKRQIWDKEARLEELKD